MHYFVLVLASVNVKTSSCYAHNSQRHPFILKKVLGKFMHMFLISRSDEQVEKTMISFMRAGFLHFCASERGVNVREIALAILVAGKEYIYNTCADHDEDNLNF
jgi:hypothetical protein